MIFTALWSRFTSKRVFTISESDNQDDDTEMDVVGEGDSQDLMNGMAPTFKHKLACQARLFE